MNAPPVVEALRAAYAEFRALLAEHRAGCATGDAERVLGAATDGAWISARIEVLARRLASEGPGGATRAEIAACEAEGHALQRELATVTAEVAGLRGALGVELARLTEAMQGLPTAYGRGGLGHTEVRDPVALDATG